MPRKNLTTPFDSYSTSYIKLRLVKRTKFRHSTFNYSSCYTFEFGEAAKKVVLVVGPQREGAGGKGRTTKKKNFF